MTTKIHKWGNSLGLRIPRSAALEAQIEEGAVVEISVVDGCLRVRALRKKRFDLDVLVNRIRPGNVHGEVHAGTPTGREVW